MHDDPAGLSMIAKAPELVLPTISSERETGRVLEVARVAYAPTPSGEDLVWLETSDGQLLRLPAGLHAWAHDTVVLVLGMGGNAQVDAFPMRIEFGILNGRPYAEML